MYKSVKHSVAKFLPSKQKIFLKQFYFKIRTVPSYIYLRKHFFKVQRKIIQKFFSYGPLQLKRKLREMGVERDDTIFVHSSFNVLNGFNGGPDHLIDCFLNVVGSSGNLLMVSMPYKGPSYEYLKKGSPFDIRNSVSYTGIVTEIFRRRKNVLRSLNPVHPVLAYGPSAAWIVADHDKTMFSCGKGSPFEKILELNTKVFLFDVPFLSMTFYHYVEDLLKDRLTFQLYDDELFESIVYDENGKEIKVRSYVFGKEARDNHKFRMRLNRALKKELMRNNFMKINKIGNTKLMLIDLREVVRCAQEMANSGRLPFNTSPSPIKLGP
jgi:aminoglycoside 3-N-acetyltransferase